MPFRLPFNFPYLLGPHYYRNTYNTSHINNTQFSTSKKQKEDSIDKDIPRSDESSEFFEIFGLKLYFDDILIICILYFLYTEGVQDQELFLCLILLLLS